jgi:hypothetical protein
VAIGGVFSLLPERLVLLVVAALFAAGAAVLLLGREQQPDGSAPAAAGPGLRRRRHRGHPDAGMVRVLLVCNRALDFGRVVTCGCPGVRGPRSPRRGPRIG